MLSNKTIRGIIRAYDDGVSLQGISQLFKVGQRDLINIIHTVKVTRRMK